MIERGIYIPRVVLGCLCLLALLLGGEVRAALADVNTTWDALHISIYDDSYHPSLYDQEETHHQAPKKKRPVRILAGEHSKFEKGKPVAIDPRIHSLGYYQVYPKRWDVDEEFVYLQFVSSLVSSKRGPPR
jgi:hypothetical protein